MFKKAFIISLFTFSILGISQAFSAPSIPAQSQNFSDLLLQANDLARKGSWNQSEIIFLKAAQSSMADHRVQAYAGLAGLYTKLRLPKKAEKAQKRLAEEKAFLAKLLPQEESYYEVYTLKEGDSYAKIASRKKISLEWLKRINQNKPLISGKTMQVPRLGYLLLVNKSTKTMEWRRGDELLKIYPIAVGKKETETPAGEFEIISKVKNPVWYHLKLQIPPESPKNLLGPRWLGLNVKGYGIHGTRNPKSINYAVSHGCVRMYNRDVEELFEWIPIGTRVIIRDANEKGPEQKSD